MITDPAVWLKDALEAREDVRSAVLGVGEDGGGTSLYLTLTDGSQHRIHVAPPFTRSYECAICARDLVTRH